MQLIILTVYALIFVCVISIIVYFAAVDCGKVVKLGKAYLLDEDIFLKGIVKRKGLHKMFIPNEGIDCGFSYQVVKKEDIGKILFYDINDVFMTGFLNPKIIRGIKK